MKLRKRTQFLLAIPAAIIFVAFMHSGDNTPKKPKEVYKTTARQLFKDYDRNEVATDEAMKGKAVAVLGIIQSIDKGFTGSISIKFKTDNQFLPARMSVSDKQKSFISTLKPGDKIEVLCDKMERLVGSPSGSDCVIQ